MSSYEEVCKNVTAVVKTFERPKLVKRLVKSVKKYYPDLRIIVVDDSKYPIEHRENIDEYYHVAFDTGLSYGRNFGIEKVKTKYYLLLDDDLIFLSNTKLEKMYEVLESTSFAIVGAPFIDFGIAKEFDCGFFEKKDASLIMHIGKSLGEMDGFPKYSYVTNFYMADIERLEGVRYDPTIKIGPEHGDFFYELQKREIFSTYLTEIGVGHYHSFTTFNYDKFRLREEYQQIFLKKNQVKKLDLVEYKEIMARHTSKFDNFLLKLYKSFQINFIRRPLQIWNLISKKSSSE